jgi:5-methylcytosine-specific restriction endonuclease McrA
MARREFSTGTKASAFHRCGGKCESCGAYLYTGKFHFDHDTPDGLTGEPTLENCKVLCVNCHSEKTRTIDVPRIARAKRREAKHIGAKKPRGFRKPDGVKYDWKTGRYERP